MPTIYPRAICECSCGIAKLFGKSTYPTWKYYVRNKEGQYKYVVRCPIHPDCINPSPKGEFPKPKVIKILSDKPLSFIERPKTKCNYCMNSLHYLCRFDNCTCTRCKQRQAYNKLNKIV